MEMAARGHERAAAPHGLFLEHFGASGVQKCEAVPHGSGLSRGRVVGRGGNAKYWSLGTLGAMLERSGTAKSLRFPRKRSLTTTMQGRLCCHELAVALDEVEEVLGDGYDLIGYAPFIRRGPASLQAPAGGRYLRLAAPRRPRRLNVHVSRTLKAAASGK